MFAFSLFLCDYLANISRNTKHSHAHTRTHCCSLYMPTQDIHALKFCLWLNCWAMDFQVSTVVVV